MTLTLVDVFSQYLAETCGNAPSTQYQQFRFFQRALRQLGTLPLEAVTPDVLRTWKAALALRCKPGTVHRYMGYLSSALHYAVARGWLAHNPMTGVRKPSPGRGRVRFLSPEERQRLLAACRGSRNPYLYTLVVLALATGGRKNELRCLRWPEVDLARGVVRLVRTKTHLDRTVPVLGEASALLAALARTRRPDIPWVFARPDGLKPRAIDTAWVRARDRARLADVHFHDLRHTFASYMAMSGASLRDIAEVLGHRDIQMTMIYAHLVPSHVRGVVERMLHTMLV